MLRHFVCWIYLLLPSLALSQRRDVTKYAPRTVIAKVFPAIVDPKIADADHAQLSGNDLVIGVVVNGEPRAYPINQLTGPRREIINDVLGGMAIAATW